MSGFGNLFDKPTHNGLFGPVPADMLGSPPKTLGQIIAEALQATPPAPPPPANAFNNALAQLLSPPAPPFSNPFNNVMEQLLSPAAIGSPVPGAPAYGISAHTARPYGIPFAPPRPAPIPEQVRRKIFFSFYYAGDIRRSCIVRNSYMFRKGSKPPSASFYDRSLWEKSKREGEESLKRLIREGMADTSVTCILGGTHTWARPWVRFEIAHSLLRSNGLFTCFIHNVCDANLGRADPGFDPLSFMGLELREDGRGNVVELIGQDWWHFEAMKRSVPWPAWMPKPSVGRLFRLSDYAPAYDYCIDDGYENLCRWAHAAAHAARRR